MLKRALEASEKCKIHSVQAKVDVNVDLFKNVTNFNLNIFVLPGFKHILKYVVVNHNKCACWSTSYNMNLAELQEMKVTQTQIHSKDVRYKLLKLLLYRTHTYVLVT